MVISTGAEKVFEKLPTLFHNKLVRNGRELNKLVRNGRELHILNWLGMEGNLINLIKCIYKQTTTLYNIQR